MFKALKQRFRDMGHLTKLFNEAERLANSEGQAEPGAEHLVMAALTMPDDDSARRALAQQGASPDAFWAAVSQQYVDALKTIGIDSSPLIERETAMSSPSERRGLYRSTGSMRDLLDAVTSNKETTRASAAEFILGATEAKFGVVARALDRLGIDRERLAESARAEIGKRAFD